MQIKIEGVNGAKIVINSAPFVDVMTLKSAIQKELANSNIKLDVTNLSMESEIDIGSIIKVIMQIDSSKEFYESLFKCLNRCTYNDQKVTETLFDNDDIREDYYTLAVECLKVNLKPFLKGLVSSFPKLLTSLHPAQK